MIREEVEKLRGVLFTPEELESVIIPAVEATTEEKKLWKIGYTDNYNTISCSRVFELKIKYKESDIRELTTSEAKGWFKQFRKEKPYAGLFKLYHKKYGEWILYEEEK